MILTSGEGGYPITRLFDDGCLVAELEGVPIPSYRCAGYSQPSTLVLSPLSTLSAHRDGVLNLSNSIHR